MGQVYTDITLMNAGDVTNVERGFIPEAAIRQTTVQALVDTGAVTLVINEAIRQKLGLIVRDEDEATLANNVTEIVQITDPIEVHWKDRGMVCQPWVIADAGEVLLGAIPLEDMDLIVDPKQQEVVGRHGDKRIGRI